MDFRPAWSVDRFVLGKFNLFWTYCYICILDFVLYEYSSFSSVQDKWKFGFAWNQPSDLLVRCLSKFFDNIVQTCKLLKENVRYKRKTGENQDDATGSVV